MIFYPRNNSEAGSRTAATSKMERFVVIVNGWKPLTIIKKSSMLDVAAVLDPPLQLISSIQIFIFYFSFSGDGRWEEFFQHHYLHYFEGNENNILQIYFFCFSQKNVSLFILISFSCRDVEIHILNKFYIKIDVWLIN